MRQIFTSNIVFAVCGFILGVVTLWEGIKTARDTLTVLFSLLFFIMGISNMFGLTVLKNALNGALVVASDPVEAEEEAKASEPKKDK